MVVYCLFFRMKHSGDNLEGVFYSMTDAVHYANKKWKLNPKWKTTDKTYILDSVDSLFYSPVIMQGEDYSDGY